MATRRLPGLLWGSITLLALVFVACGDTKRQGGGGVAGQAGAGDPSGAGGDVAGRPQAAAGEGGGGGSERGPTAAQQLKACDAEEHCGRSFAQLIEGSTEYIDTEGTVCLLEALRDRRPGRYFHEADATNTATSTSVEHVLVVNGTGDVVQAVRRHSSKYDGSSSSSERGERCRLKPPSYFEDCAAAVAAAEDAIEGAAGASGSDAWDCVFGSQGQAPSPMPWFESCAVDAELTCDAPEDATP